MEPAVRSSVQMLAPAASSLRASIIIVNYNAGERLLRCITSVLQSGEQGCEIIVVDNASCDGASTVIEADFPGVLLIRSKTNAGFGAGNNLGAVLASGKFLAFLNPDTVVERGWLDALLAPFDSEEAVGLVTSRILLADQPDRINACGNDVHISGLTLCRGFGRPRSFFNEVEDVDAISGAAFAIRRELFAELNGFDEDAFLYMEDTDLSWRARLMGWRCICAPESILVHDYALRFGPLKTFYQERNRYLMLLKTLRWPTLLVLLPALLLAEAVSWGFVPFGGFAHFKNKLLAYAWVFNNWSGIMSKRRGVQGRRKARDRELLRHTTYKLGFSQVVEGTIARLAAIVFNPLFFALRAIALMVVWW